MQKRVDKPEGIPILATNKHKTYGKGKKMCKIKREKKRWKEGRRRTIFGKILMFVCTCDLYLHSWVINGQGLFYTHLPNPGRRLPLYQNIIRGPIKYISETLVVIKCLLPFVNFVQFRTDHVIYVRPTKLQAFFVCSSMGWREYAEENSNHARVPHAVPLFSSTLFDICRNWKF